MSQVTWRASEELVARVQRAAALSGRSMNQFLTIVLDAATDPEVQTDEAIRVRERLAHVGLLATVAARAVDIDETALRAAKRRAGGGTALADLVAAERG